MGLKRCVAGCVLLLGTACSGSAVDAPASSEPAAPGAQPVACATGPGVTKLAEVPIGTQPAVDGTDVIVSTTDALLRIPVAGGDAAGIGRGAGAGWHGNAKGARSVAMRPPRNFYLQATKRGAGMLSRVADSLYWMGRYLERAEHTARLVNADEIQDLPLGDVEAVADRVVDFHGFNPVG